EPAPAARGLQAHAMPHRPLPRGAGSEPLFERWPAEPEFHGESLPLVVDNERTGYNVHQRRWAVQSEDLTMNLSIAEVRNNLADALNRVAYAGERVVLERRGKPVAVLVSMDDLELLQRIEDEMD